MCNRSDYLALLSRGHERIVDSAPAVVDEVANYPAFASGAPTNVRTDHADWLTWMTVSSDDRVAEGWRAPTYPSAGRVCPSRRCYQRAAARAGAIK